MCSKFWPHTYKLLDYQLLFENTNLAFRACHGFEVKLDGRVANVKVYRLDDNLMINLRDGRAQL